MGLLASLTGLLFEEGGDPAQTAPATPAAAVHVAPSGENGQASAPVMTADEIEDKLERAIQDGDPIVMSILAKIEKLVAKFVAAGKGADQAYADAVVAVLGMDESHTPDQFKALILQALQLVEAKKGELQTQFAHGTETEVSQLTTQQAELASQVEEKRRQIQQLQTDIGQLETERTTVGENIVKRQQAGQSTLTALQAAVTNVQATLNKLASNIK